MPASAVHRILFSVLTLSPPQYPRSLSYNPAENAVLINLDGDGGSYELHIIPKDAASGRGEPADTKRGAGAWATFVARNRFAVLDKPAGQILVRPFARRQLRCASLCPSSLLLPSCFPTRNECTNAPPAL